MLFSEVFRRCSNECPILSHFYQPIQSYSHLEFWSAKFGSAFYQLFRLLYRGNCKRPETEILATIITHGTAQKMKFSIKDFFRKCGQIRSFLRNFSHFLKKSLMENFIFCVVLIPNTYYKMSKIQNIDGPTQEFY